MVINAENLVLNDGILCRKHKLTTSRVLYFDRKNVTFQAKNSKGSNIPYVDRKADTQIYDLVIVAFTECDGGISNGSHRIILNFVENILCYM
jgi:hypothetical protein